MGRECGIQPTGRLFTFLQPCVLGKGFVEFSFSVLCYLSLALFEKVGKWLITIPLEKLVVQSDIEVIKEHIQLWDMH